MRRLFPMLLLLLFSGCAVLPLTDSPNDQVLTEEQLLQQARSLQQEQQWSKATALLERGMARFPRSEPLAELRASVRRGWQLQKRNREDWILVHEVRALQRKLPYLESLVEIDPENYITKSRLLFWRSLLESKVADLIACGSLHLHLDKALAEECATLADEIKPTEQSAHLLARIRQDEAAEEKKSRARQLARSKRQMERRRTELLQQAESDFSSGNYRESAVCLNELLEMNPDDNEAQSLLHRVEEAREREVQRLLTYGDRLYREEQIEQAVSVWESADRLAPGRTDIAVRIERAMRVLQTLQEIQRTE